MCKGREGREGLVAKGRRYAGASNSLGTAGEEQDSRGTQQRCPASWPGGCMPPRGGGVQEPAAAGGRGRGFPGARGPAGGLFAHLLRPAQRHRRGAAPATLFVFSSVLAVARAAPAVEAGTPCVHVCPLAGWLAQVAAQEGRLLFMTTNHIDKLSSALIRPGRVRVLLALVRGGASPPCSKDQRQRSAAHGRFAQLAA